MIVDTKFQPYSKNHETQVHLAEHNITMSQPAFATPNIRLRFTHLEYSAKLRTLNLYYDVFEGQQSLIDISLEFVSAVTGKLLSKPVSLLFVVDTNHQVFNISNLVLDVASQFSGNDGVAVPLLPILSTVMS